TPLLLRWGIKTKTNDQVRQEFLNEHVPELLDAGLTIPDPDLRYDEKTGNWIHGPIPWDDFWKVINGEGPMNRHRLMARRRAHEEGRWVREALEAYGKRHLVQAAD
ncbi:1,2-phenylacetyl-CoA epoxidase subunit A, partial [Thermus scotoductus]